MKLRVRIEGRDFTAEVGDLNARPIRVKVDGKEFEVWPEKADVRHAPKPRPAGQLPLSEPKTAPAGPAAELTRSVRAPIPGVIISVAVQVGSPVAVGQELCVLEAMKMKNAIRASRAGTVSAVHVSAGQHVRHDDLLFEFAG